MLTGVTSFKCGASLSNCYVVHKSGLGKGYVSRQLAHVFVVVLLRCNSFTHLVFLRVDASQSVEVINKATIRGKYERNCHAGNAYVTVTHLMLRRADLGYQGSTSQSILIYSVIIDVKLQYGHDTQGARRAAGDRGFRRGCRPRHGFSRRPKPSGSG
jgi:hypothetical protein